MIRAEGFREANALIVRPHPNGDYQIVSGHRRWHAADLAGLTAVPCEVREMDDATAYMLLQTQNTDSALSPIEAGLHQLSSGMPQRDYAERAHVNRNSLKVKVDAARVYEKIKAKVAIAAIGDRWRVLAVLRSASEWLWPLWAPRLLKGGAFEKWTVDDTARVVKKVGHAPEPPTWANASGVAHKLATGTETPEDVRAMSRLLAGAKGRGREQLTEALKAAKPASLAEARLVVEAQTPISPVADDGETPEPTPRTEWRLPENASGGVHALARYRGALPGAGVTSEPVGEPPTPQHESITIEPVGELRAEGHVVELRHRLRAQERFQQMLKTMLEPLPDFDDVPEEARAEICDVIDSLIRRLTIAKEELERAKRVE